MRTVKLEMLMPGPHSAAPSMRFSTEVIIDDDDDAGAAGTRAGLFLMHFAEGVAGSAPEEDDG